MSGFSNAAKTVLAVGGTSILLSGVASAAVVNQGDKIWTDFIGPFQKTCTVGYIDKEHNSFWTAAHCVNGEGSQVKNAAGENIGTVKHRDTSYPENFNYQDDVAVVSINSGHAAGENVYSGDQIANPADIKSGDPLKAYGSKTGRVYSGYVSSSRDGVTYSNSGMESQSGDSGGPAWIDGKGFIGVTTGTVSSSGNPVRQTIWNLPNDVVNNAPAPVKPAPEVQAPQAPQVQSPVAKPAPEAPQAPEVNVPPAPQAPVPQFPQNIKLPAPQPWVNPQANAVLHQAVNDTAAFAHQGTDVVADVVRQNVDVSNQNVADLVNGCEGRSHEFIDITAANAHSAIDTWVPAQ